MARGSWITRAEISGTPRALNRLILLCIYGCVDVSGEISIAHAHETRQSPIPAISRRIDLHVAGHRHFYPTCLVLSFRRPITAGLCISGFRGWSSIIVPSGPWNEKERGAATKIPKELFPAISQRAVLDNSKSRVPPRDSTVFHGISKKPIVAGVLVGSTGVLYRNFIRSTVFFHHGAGVS